MPSHIERRRHERFGFRVPAHITRNEDENLHRGYIMNLSESGAFVMLDEPVAAETPVNLRFRIKPGTWCEASGHLSRTLPLGNKHAFGIVLTERNAGFDFFVRNLAIATDIELMSFVRDMGRVYIRLGQLN